jgi:hypothetical protein
MRNLEYVIPTDDDAQHRRRVRCVWFTRHGAWEHGTLLAVYRGEFVVARDGKVKVVEVCEMEIGERETVKQEIE